MRLLFRSAQVETAAEVVSMTAPTHHIGTIPLRTPLFRGVRRLHIALVGLPNSGKSTLFAAVASTSVQSGALSGTRRAYNECAVQIGLDEARVIDLPSIRSPHHLDSEDRAALKYLLWGDERPPVSLHEPDGPPAPFAPPDVIVQVLDATSLEHHLELTLKLVKFGRPLVIALNKMDEAEDRGTYVNGKALSAKLGVAVVPVTAIMLVEVPAPPWMKSVTNWSRISPAMRRSHAATIALAMPASSTPRSRLASAAAFFT